MVSLMESSPLSSLQSDGLQLKGELSGLFCHFPRVLLTLTDTFQTMPIQWILEKLFSMKPESLEISRILQVQPILLDAKHFAHCTGL